MFASYFELLLEQPSNFPTITAESLNYHGTIYLWTVMIARTTGMCRKLPPAGLAEMTASHQLADTQ